MREGLFRIISQSYWAILKSLYYDKEISVIPPSLAHERLMSLIIFLVSNTHTFEEQ